MAGCLDKSGNAGTLVFIQTTFQAGALDIGLGGNTTGCLDEVRKTLVLLRQVEIAFENNLTQDLYRTGVHKARRTAYLYHVVGLQHKAGLTINYQSVLQRETVVLGDFLTALKSLGVTDTTRDIDLGIRSGIGQATGTENEVFNGLTLGIREGTRTEHLTGNGDGTLGRTLRKLGDNQLVLVAKGNVGQCTAHNTTQVERLGLKGAVLLHAVQHGTTGKGILGQTTGSLDESTDGIDLISQLITAGAEHSTLNLYHILITVQHGIDLDDITISHLEARHIELLNGMDTITLARHTGEANGLLKGITGITTGILDGLGNRLGGAHLVNHRALHLSLDIHQSLIGTYDNHVVLLQTDITSQTTIQDVLIDID